MLSMAYALPAGNAVRLVLSPPTGADELALLRRDDGAAPAGLNDAAAVPVYRGDPVRSVLDWLAVPAGVELRYRALWRVGSSWLDGGVRSVRADARFLDRSVEPLLVMRDRLDLGLRGYVERGELRPSSGEIPVLIASPLIEETPMPVVTVHLESEVQDVAPVGGLLAPDRGADSFTGHVSRVVMKAIGWSLNVDERLALRRAMTAVLAYSSVAQIAYVVEGLGIGSYLGIYGGLFHLVNHTVVKGLLFLSVGAIIYSAGKRSIAELSKMKLMMPITAFAFFTGIFALAGMPPLNGFVSKFTLFLAVGQAHLLWAAIIGIITSLFTLVCFFQAGYRIFWAEKDIHAVGAEAYTATEVPAGMLLGMVFLALTAIALGIFPGIIHPLLDNATKCILRILIGG